MEERKPNAMVFDYNVLVLSETGDSEIDRCTSK